MSGWMFDVDAFILVAALVFAASWLLVGIGRLQYAWVMGNRQNASLKEQQIREAKELLKIAQEVLSLEEEIKEAREGISKASKQETEKNKALADRPPPAASEIWVPSEFPASRRDYPWVAHLKRSNASRARAAGAPRYALVWAADHASALGRAHALVVGDTDVEVEGLRRFGP